MERRQVTVKNSQLVSYNRFDSNKDGIDEDNLANQNVRTIRQDGPPVSRYYRLAAVCLTLLCVLLIFAVLGLWVKFNNMTTKNTDLQTHYNNLILKNDQLESSNNNLTVERNRLQTSYDNLTIVRAQDQEKCKELANEMNKLQTNYSSMANQQDQLQKENEKLQNNFGELAAQGRVGWVYFNFSLYFISNEKNIWYESRLNCRKKGADLVVIQSKEEEDFLVEQLGSDKAWIGLNDRNTEGVWKWEDGTTVTTAFWAPGEPNDAGYGEDCAELWGFKEKQGWNDGWCRDNVRWVCKKPFHTSQ